jgi:hypothetical protein
MDDSFEAGFMFAVQVFQTFTGDVTEDGLAKRLAEIRDGERTLRPSPPDAIAGIEVQIGAPLPGNLRNSVNRLLGDRTAFREEERAKAARILEMMGDDGGMA